MLKKTYDVATLVPYINWLYCYHAWGLSGKSKEEKLKLRLEAEQMLGIWQNDYHTHALFALFEAVSDGDDIIIENSVRFPMLRQQHPAAPGEPNLCLADFIRPKSGGVADHLGVFCPTVDLAQLKIASLGGSKHQSRHTGRHRRSATDWLRLRQKNCMRKCAANIGAMRLMSNSP